MNSNECAVRREGAHPRCVGAVLREFAQAAVERDLPQLLQDAEGAAGRHTRGHAAPRGKRGERTSLIACSVGFAHAGTPLSAL